MNLKPTIATQPEPTGIHARTDLSIEHAPHVNVDRILMTDTLLGAVEKLASDHPGAIVSLSALMNASVVLDADSALGAWGPLFTLDRCRLYGEQIYRLHHDLCNGVPLAALACLRAVQLGYLPEARLHHAIATNDAAVPVTCFELVQQHLPTFGGGHGR